MRLLLLAVVAAQALDTVTWMAMPSIAEANPLVQGIHSAQGTALKALLLVYLFAVEALIRLAPPPRFEVVAVVNRTLAEIVAIVAIAVGCIGAGANLSVLTVYAAETPRSVQEPAPIAPDATGFEQGPLEPAAPGRTPAPPGSDVPRGTPA